MGLAANPEIINPKMCSELEEAAFTSLCLSSAAWPADGFSSNTIFIILPLHCLGSEFGSFSQNDKESIPVLNFLREKWLLWHK